MTVPAGDLLADTTLVPDDSVEGRYHGIIPAAWRIEYAFGGVTMTAALRAMQEHLGRPDLQLVTANAIFCAPVPVDVPIVADVSILRLGRGASQVACDIRVEGGETVAIRAHGVFGKNHDSPMAFQDAQFPDDVWMPEECPPEVPRPAEFDFPRLNFHHQTEWKPALKGAKAPWEPGYEPGPARFASWTRLLKEPRLPDGSYDPVAMGVPADSIGPAVGRGAGPANGHFMVLSLEIGLRFLRAPTTSPAWILQDMQCWQCGDGYATGPTLLWDQDRNLLAIASQTAHTRSWTPPKF